MSRVDLRESEVLAYTPVLFGRWTLTIAYAEIEDAVLRRHRWGGRVWLCREAGDVTLKAAEIQEIARALQAEGGRVERAAQRLGVPRSSLYQKIRKYGIAIPKA